MTNERPIFPRFNFDPRFILRALDRNGNQYFYTGRAGAAWVSPNEGEAFHMSRVVASSRAQSFNANESLHGLWFIVLHDTGRPASDFLDDPAELAASWNDPADKANRIED